MGMEGLVACESFFSIFQTRPRYAKVHFVQPWSTKDGVAKAIGTLRSTYEVIDIERAMARHSAPCTGHHLGISYEIAGPFYVDIYIYIVFYILSCHTTCVVRHNFNFISISYHYNRLTTHEGSQAEHRDVDVPESWGNTSTSSAWFCLMEPMRLQRWMVRQWPKFLGFKQSSGRKTTTEDRCT